MTTSRNNYFRYLYLILLLFLPLLLSGVIKETNSQPQKTRIENLHLTTFDIDVTPPLGYDIYGKPMQKSWDMGLRAKGIVLLGAGKPIILVAFDWIGIAMLVMMNSRKSC